MWQGLRRRIAVGESGGSFGADEEEKGDRNLGSDTLTRNRPESSNGRTRFGELENVMGIGSGEGIRFPGGREFRYGKAGNVWLAAMRGQRRSLREQAQ